MGHTHASFDVLEPALPLRRGLELVLEGVAAAFFWAIPEVVDPANLTLYCFEAVIQVEDAELVCGVARLCRQQLRA